MTVGRAAARSPRTTRTPIPRCSCPARSSSARRAARSTCGTVRNWWSWMPGADWRHPEGPGSNVGGRELPSGRRTSRTRTPRPTPSGRARRCRPRRSGSTRPAAGSTARRYTWGDEFAPKGRMMANTWQGEFPWQNLLHRRLRGHLAGRALPAERLRALRHGRQRLGVDGRRRSRSRAPSGRPCCAPQLRAPATGAFPRKVIKGGSHLCAPNYCLRYRPAARQGETVDTSTCHIGFRCVVRTT